MVHASSVVGWSGLAGARHPGVQGLLMASLPCAWVSHWKKHRYEHTLGMPFAFFTDQAVGYIFTRQPGQPSMDVTGAVAERGKQPAPGGSQDQAAGCELWPGR